MRPGELPAVAGEVVSADHPCLAGHFPGRPILPAVLLLEKVAGSLRAIEPSLSVTGVSEAKFVRPVLPEQRFTIHLGTPQAGRVAFEIRSEIGLLVYGRLRTEPRAGNGCL